MNRDIDPCNCSQACEYADLLQQAKTALRKLIYASNCTSLVTIKEAVIMAETIGACLDKYEEATREYADEGDNEYEPPNER